MPFIQSEIMKNSLYSVVKAKDKSTNEIIKMRREIEAKPPTLLPDVINVDAYAADDKVPLPPTLSMTTNVDKPKKKRRKRGTVKNWVGTRRKSSSSSSLSDTIPIVRTGGSIVKKTRHRKIVNLTSPQRASLRQIISKRKTEMQEPLEWLRTVEYAQNPDTNQSEQNKIIFASALGLLPIKKHHAGDSGNVSESDSVIGGVSEMNNFDWIHRKKINTYDDTKQRIEIVHDALTSVMLNDNKLRTMEVKKEEMNESLFVKENAYDKDNDDDDIMETISTTTNSSDYSDSKVTSPHPHQTVLCQKFQFFKTIWKIINKYCSKNWTQQ